MSPATVVAWLRWRAWNSLYWIVQAILGSDHELVVAIADRNADARILLWRTDPGTAPIPFLPSLAGQTRAERLRLLFAAISDEAPDGDDGPSVPVLRDEVS